MTCPRLIGHLKRRLLSVRTIICRHHPKRNTPSYRRRNKKGINNRNLSFPTSLVESLSRSNNGSFAHGTFSRHHSDTLTSVHHLINRSNVSVPITRTYLVRTRILTRILQVGSVLIDILRLIPNTMIASCLLMLLTRHLTIRAITQNGRKSTRKDTFGLPLSYFPR